MKKIVIFLGFIVLGIIIAFTILSIIAIKTERPEGESLFESIFKSDKNDDKLGDEKDTSKEENLEIEEELDIDNLDGEGDYGDTSVSSSNCVVEKISYSLMNSDKITTCNQYQEEICIDKTVECSIEIHNRDSEVSDLFEVELIFLEEGETKEEPIDIKISSFTPQPQDFKIFRESINVQSTGEDGVANKNINCFFNTLKVPTKEVC